MSNQDLLVLSQADGRVVGGVELEVRRNGRVKWLITSVPVDAHEAARQDRPSCAPSGFSPADRSISYLRLHAEFAAPQVVAIEPPRRSRQRAGGDDRDRLQGETASRFDAAPHQLPRPTLRPRVV